MEMFHQGNIVERFPRGLSLTRVLDALEINLFLEHRYKGLFMPPKRSGRKNPLGVVSLVTMNSLANSMLLFLQWIEAHDVDRHEVYAVSDSDKAKYWLLVYRKYLIYQVIAKKIDRDTANLYINHVCTTTVPTTAFYILACVLLLVMRVLTMCTYGT